MSLSITNPFPRPAISGQARVKTIQATIPLYIYAVSLASLLTVIGVLWDISWHKSIGRDKFLSPPHILIYLGAIFAGLSSGIQVLWNSYKPSASFKSTLVRVWGIFYSSLGALFCIWGAIAMLTSAPFDDWWHSAYGLDVTILSPPHTLLAMGMIFLQFGACVSISKYLNERAGEDKAVLCFLFIVCACSLLVMIYTLFSDYVHTRAMRNSPFYIIASFVALLFLPAFGRVLRLKWGMTAIALGYFLVIAIPSWILQLFPAEPKLGPILTHTTHFQAAQFPLLIFIPALAMDLILQRSAAVNDWKKAAWLSISFVLVLLLVQYPVGGFLLESPAARNWFFGAESWYFGIPPDAIYRYKFHPNDIASWPALTAGIGIAIVLGLFTARLSLRWGKWLQSIQR